MDDWKSYQTFQENVTLRYNSLADPLGDGSGVIPVPESNVLVGGVPLGGAAPVSISSSAMINNDWFDFEITPFAPALGSGVYSYLLNVSFPNAAIAAVTINNFKVRVGGTLSVIGNQEIGFVGALFSPNDVETVYLNGTGDLSVTTYDGKWTFQLSIPAALSSLKIFDGDLDSTEDLLPAGDDPNSGPGSPGEVLCDHDSNAGTPDISVPDFVDCGANPDIAEEGVSPFVDPNDDNPFCPVCVRSPSIQYDVVLPDGVTTFSNTNTSGNKEWELFEIDTDLGNLLADDHTASLPPGIYTIKIDGMDMGNVNVYHIPHSLGGLPTGSIGDRVWHDVTCDDVQDGGEGGINGVTVHLYQDVNLDGVLDAGDTLLDSQVTSGDGDYDFLGLPEGQYIVDVDESTLPPAFDPLSCSLEPHPKILDIGEDYDNADFGYRFAEECGPCDGKVTELTLQYTGASSALVQVSQH